MRLGSVLDGQQRAVSARDPRSVGAKSLKGITFWGLAKLGHFSWRG